MNKQTDAIFAKMVEKYAKTAPLNGEITPEILEEVKTEMNKSWFVQNLKATCEQLENEFRYKNIGINPKKTIKVAVNPNNFTRNTSHYTNRTFDEFMEGEPTIFRLQVNLDLPNCNSKSSIWVRSSYFYTVYSEFTKYQSSKLTTFVHLNDRNVFPDEIEIEYELIGKEAYEIMIELHKQEIANLESEIKKLN